MPAFGRAGRLHGSRGPDAIIVIIKGGPVRTILLAAIALAVGPANAQTPSPSFCERLAPQLGMTAKTKGGAVLWEVNPLGGLKTALFGGSAIISFSVAPVGEPSVADYQRVQGTCAQSGKEVVCRVTEPLHLKVQAKSGAAQVEAAPGEQATVATRGTRITCRDG